MIGSHKEIQIKPRLFLTAGEDYIGPEYLEMPLSPPRIQQENGSFLIGSRLDLNCTSALSYPPIYLQWLVNNREVSCLLKTTGVLESWPERIRVFDLVRIGTTT